MTSTTTSGSAAIGLASLIHAGILVLLRISGVVAFAPPFNSPGVPARVKAVFCAAVAFLVAPVVAVGPGIVNELSLKSLFGEVAFGILFGLTLAFLREVLTFAATLMGVPFSFSLANLMDPNSEVETEVLGTLLNWMGVLVLLSAGLHRTMIAAVLRSFTTVPAGTVSVSATTGRDLLFAAAGIFLAGVQLAAPVVSSALLVEVAISLVSRMAPAMPAQVVSVPLKSLVSYVVLIGSLALWPGWIERHFTALLDRAQQMVRP